jgi:endogenous inhibitor of DNA gyrase (YacG/DUF329 family)
MRSRPQGDNWDEPTRITTGAEMKPRRGEMPATDMPRTCAHCRALLRAEVRSDARYCSNRCRQEAWLAQQMPTVTDRCCLHCGKPVSASVRADARYCSRRCQQRACARRRMDPLKGQRKTLKTLGGVGLNPAEASILLAASGPVVLESHAYSARRLFNLGLVKTGRARPDWRRAVTRTRLGDRLVTLRQEELTRLVAKVPEIAMPLGNRRIIKWGDA